ncbi:LysR family transcriptional regulator [Roseateles sp. So40a]|uniref:LysR family transcriptional regulator n=1 Tax=Roseateles sp. So40a TaxID=3400226 RepID=UPI003A84FC1E
MAEQKRTGLRQGVDWEDLRVFLALGRHGSLSAAARALSVNHATISRRIQSLEARLGEKLVDRRPDGYLLTAAGRLALSAASDMEAAALQLAREGDADGADGAVRGLVRVNAPPALSQGFLIDRLAALSVAHPALDIDLATDLRAVSLDRHKADIAVRLSRPRDGDYIAQPLGTMGFGCYGTPARCEAVERGEPPVFVGFDEENADMPDATWLARSFPRARVALRANNHMSQAIAARAGAGLAMLPHYIGRQVPGLRPCALTPVRESREMWLLIRGQDRKDRPIRTVADHLRRVFEEAQALFAP